MCDVKNVFYYYAAFYLFFVCLILTDAVVMSYVNYINY